MPESVEVTPEESQFVETKHQSEEKSAGDILADKSLTDYNEEQQSFKELDSLLEPAIIELDNGEISHKTFKEIVEEALEEISEENK